MLNLFFLIVHFIYSSIYSLSINDAGGNPISLSTYQGKKILVVNIATGSDRVSQLAGLQQLQDQYADKLVIIACPSASFGHETRTDSQVTNFCETVYHTSFLIAAKNPVAGTGMQPLFEWLTHSSNNGVYEGEVTSDFQKFLVDEEGNFIGSFSARVEPTDPKLVQLIAQ